MPEISRFFGIVITMYHNDHAPPHFHARYGEQKALIAIDSAEIIEGELSSRAKSLIKEWTTLHREELKADWELARGMKELQRIPPLDRKTMLKDITSVQLVRDRRLALTFEDGARGEVDIAAMIPFVGVFSDLNDAAYFGRVRVNKETGTIEWPNGADLDPDVLYSRATGQPLPDFGDELQHSGIGQDKNNVR